ncbi:3-hydroxybutyryl-CoA dehydrogenase [Acinetobacter qingfengensis]|uniref:3-hydroxybutyryl-CoA dehydrogenase n=1 Tax=Acinetobacter qingfengensis TaxID=1262585 RepID=A0A1E7R7P1_9GAMM|nr:3-hydroxybutyryl-CoA dehydrogenase [Acinetobacter qingfengensis]OEY95321.1 3-hydroxybutyryl-CoA dehydrogenase [Acinetobacter qingfengensis]
MKKTILFSILLLTTSFAHAENNEQCDGVAYAADTLMTFHQMGCDVEKAKSIYSNIFKEEGEIFNQIVDEVKKSPTYTKEEEAEKAIEDFKNKWKKYCIENNIK